VRGAEAPPAVVERVATILAAVARRPRGSFRVTSSAPGARVFLDDREIGSLPRIVRAPVGTHVLRVEAPGRSPWGRVFDVLEGRRPPVVVELAPDPIAIAGRRLTDAARSFDGSSASRQLAALGLDTAWLVWVGAASEDRALLARCDRNGCEPTRRLALEEVPFIMPAVAGSTSETPGDEALAAQDRLWLRERLAPPPPPAPLAWYERWYVWGGVGVALAAIAAAIAVSAQPEPTQVYQVDVLLPQP
jgi:hypothetical protein